MRVIRGLRLPVILAALLAAAPALAAAKDSGPPRASDGHADLSGVWTNASVTHLTRMPGTSSLVVSPEDAKRLAANSGQVRRQEVDAKPISPTAGAPGQGDPGGYNAFWLDAGASLGLVKGQFRTSWIVDPADGQLPLTDEGKARAAQAAIHTRRAETPDGPDSFEPWDRCIIGSRGSGGPGMLNNIYNSNYQIVQTPGSVAIVSEMIHDVRDIPIFPSKAAAQAGHGPAALHPWLGDSVAWWEGDTLVIETVNVNAEQGRAGPIFTTPAAKVVERLTRASKDQIFYEFTVDDPVYYKKPWRAEMSLNAIAGQVYEYACHEANYALVDILMGTRATEKAAPKSGGN